MIRELRKPLTALAAVALLLVFAFPVQAALMDSFMNQLTELNNVPLTVDKFDNMGGALVLTKVTVNISGTLTSSGTITNTSSGPDDFTIATLVNLYAGTVQGGTPAALPDPFVVIPPFTVIASQNYNQLPVGVPTAFGPGSTNNTNTFMTVNPAELAQFVGAGDTFTYLLNTTIGTSTSGGGGSVDTSITTLAGGSLDVIYESRPVDIPEPALLLLVGTGMVGLSVASRVMRRRRND